MRFNGITVPSGATITRAYVQFQVDEKTSGQTELTIRGEAVANGQTFTSAANNISNRTLTANSVGWSPNPWSTVGAAGADQQTTDISAILQEIVALPDWTAGNSVVLIISGTGERVAESYNGSNSGAPLLHVEFIP